MKKIRIISDIHGFYKLYFKLTKEAEYSIQIGDLCGDYSKLNKNPNKHKVFSGNHDDHDIFYDLPQSMGRYGEFELNGIKGFFVAGGFSIDYLVSITEEMKGGPKQYWINEELSPEEMDDCLELYSKVKPDFVLSHECCRMISSRIGNPRMLKDYGFEPDWYSRTQQLLQDMWGVYEPKLWINGHMHTQAAMQIRNTLFVSLGLYCYIDVNENLELII